MIRDSVQLVARSIKKLPFFSCSLFVHIFLNKTVPKFVSIPRRSIVLPEFSQSSFLVQKGLVLEKSLPLDFFIGKKSGEMSRSRYSATKKTKKKS